MLAYVGCEEKSRNVKQYCLMCLQFDLRLSLQFEVFASLLASSSTQIRQSNRLFLPESGTQTVDRPNLIKSPSHLHQLFPRFERHRFLIILKRQNRSEVNSEPGGFRKLCNEQSNQQIVIKIKERSFHQRTYQDFLFKINWIINLFAFCIIIPLNRILTLFTNHFSRSEISLLVLWLSIERLCSLQRWHIMLTSIVDDFSMKTKILSDSRRELGNQASDFQMLTILPTVWKQKFSVKTFKLKIST